MSAPARPVRVRLGVWLPYHLKHLTDLFQRQPDARMIWGYAAPGRVAHPILSGPTARQREVTRQEACMSRFSLGCAGLVLALTLATPAWAQQGEDRTQQRAAGFELYGFVMADAVYDHTGINPQWGDAARPTRLPSFEGEFGEKGNFFFGVRQSRIGIKPHVPTALGEVTAQFDIDMFGTGVDAGRTTVRLRHAYASLGQFGFGQTESVFTDADAFPNVVDYWGPHGMAFFRNVQFRWTPISGDKQLMFALERPGASPDAGDYAGRIELADVRVRFPVPDVSGAFKWGGHDWGYLRVAGILRYTKWDDIGNEQFDLSGDAVGWGVNVSSNVNLGKKAVLRSEVVFGEGIQNYMNDAPVDLAAELTGDPVTPLTAEPLPILGVSAYLDMNWNEKWTSSLGYSRSDTDNTASQSANAFMTGQYASVNLLWYPVPNMFVGPELQYISRENARDGFTTDGIRVQVSAKYSFSANFGVQ